MFYRKEHIPSDRKDRAHTLQHARFLGCSVVDVMHAFASTYMRLQGNIPLEMTDTVQYFCMLMIFIALLKSLTARLITWWRTNQCEQQMFPPRRISMGEWV